MERTDGRTEKEEEKEEEEAGQVEDASGNHCLAGRLPPRPEDAVVAVAASLVGIVSRPTGRRGGCGQLRSYRTLREIDLLGHLATLMGQRREREKERKQEESYR